LLFAWPLLLAVAAPTPPAGFANGVNGIPRTVGAALDDARAAGFDTLRIFLRWDKIETTEGAPDWSCRYLTSADVGRDVDGDGTGDPWLGTPCASMPCGCGYSADERVATAARDGVPVMLTLVGTPAWARGTREAHCPAETPGRALPLRPDKDGAFRDFVAAVARRYGAVAYAFELWNEPDLAACESWAGTRQQYRQQILSAATVVKASGAEPGIVVAPTLEEPSGDAMDAWMDWSQPVDRLSFNLYSLDLGRALAKLDEMNAWCRANRRCPGFYVTEFGARRSGPKTCPGPRVAAPGAADVAIMKRCRKRRSYAGFFLFTLSGRTEHPECDRALLDVRGCRKGRLCTIARRFFGISPVPFACGGCGP
jgi:hypothetical protein